MTLGEEGDDEYEDTDEETEGEDDDDESEEWSDDDNNMWKIAKKRIHHQKRMETRKVG